MLAGLPLAQQLLGSLGLARVFAPAGMLHSDFFRMDMVDDDVAEGCDPIRDEDGRILGWKRNIYSYPPIGCPDSGAYVTAGDLDRFLRQAKAGSLLSPHVRDRGA